MSRRIIKVGQSIILAAILTAAPLAAQDEELKKDLTAVITLQGFPCGQAVTVKVQAENDYAVTCKDGNQYRVYLNAAGRVIVEKK